MTPNRHATTPFGHNTTATEVTTGLDLSNKHAIVTGAGGLETETARALAGAGAEVTLAARDLGVGERAVPEIVSGTGNANVRPAALDLADRASIEVFTCAWVRAPSYPDQRRWHHEAPAAGAHP